MSNLKRDNETKCCDNCIFYGKYYNVGGDLVEIKVSVKNWGRVFIF